MPGRVSIDKNWISRDLLKAAGHRGDDSTWNDENLDAVDPSLKVLTVTDVDQADLDAAVSDYAAIAAERILHVNRRTKQLNYITLTREEWLADIGFWLGQADAFAQRGEWPMNRVNCWLCDFKEVCAKPKEGRERFLKADFVKRERD